MNVTVDGALNGVIGFMEHINVRQTLWRTLLAKCSLLRGDGSHIGEPAALNSAFLMGVIELDDATSTMLNELLKRSNLDTYLFLRVLSGDIQVKTNCKPIETMKNGIIAVDTSKINQSIIRLRGIAFFALIPKNDILHYNLDTSFHGFPIKLTANNRTLFSILDVIMHELGTTEQISLRDLKFSFIGAVVSAYSCLLDSHDVRATLFDRIKNYIDNNYLDRRLTVKKILSEFHISRSHLYRLFGHVGGVHELIRRRRLNRLYNDLIKNGVKQKTLKAMAYDYGFSDGQALKRHFEAEFGFDLMNY